MAQIVKLKRTSVSGKVPTISNIELGELAMNTYDGRIFFEKNDGSATVQEILTTNAGRAITGSININGAITASYFKGDGSALTNIQATVSEQVTVTSSFDSESTIDVAHNFSSKNIIVSVYDSNDNQIIPQTVTLSDTDNVRVVLSSAQSGFVVVAKGGHIVSGSADDSNRLNGQLASYYLNYNNFNNVPSGLISGSSFSSPSQGTVRATINGSNTDVDTGLQTGDSPQFTNLTLTGNLTVQGTTTTIDSTTVNIGDNILELNYGGSATTSGILTKDATGGSTTSGSLLWNATNDYWTAGKLGSEEEILLRNTHGVISGSSQVSYTGLSNIPSGIVSGSSQLNNTTINELTINSGSFGSGSGSPTFSEIRYNNSNVMSFNQMYLGNQNGSYFSNGEYQKVVTIIPSGDSQNYQIVGRITAQNAGETHTVYFNAALRSGTLPDLSWTINYHEEYNGSRYINPLLWTKETTTAGFIFAFETLGTIYGNVTVDMDVIPRTSALLDNVTVNTNQSSEQSSVDTGYTSNEFSKTYGVNGSNVLFSNGIVSGSSQITDLTTHKETVSGASSYAVDHNLNEQYPIVQCWNTSTSQQEVPVSITTNSVNRVTVVFSTNFAGVIIVKK